MDNKKKISISLLVFGALLIIYGFYRMTFASELTKVVGPEDQTGMYILSVGAVLAIFGTGALVGKKS